ncbi:MAG: hypothetical protein D6704_05105 [Nitrospirae bacterium]|nr:MAG: hypothetical protein D6704_05105 [Nitrospirota bacterium]
MTTTSMAVRTLLIGLGMTFLLGGCAEYGIGPGGQSASISGASVAVTGPDRVAAGAQGDTLEACLARIPKDATEGQRLLAKLSCERDERDRQAILAVPGP